VDITPSTIPGVGHSHEITTRTGRRFSVLVEHTGRRVLLVDRTGGADDAVREQIVLDPDEADQLADLLHQRSVADRLAELERQVARLAGNPANRRVDA
jgi:TrkA domain protein